MKEVDTQGVAVVSIGEFSHVAGRQANVKKTVAEKEQRKRQKQASAKTTRALQTASEG
jgi:formylmethanofuran dehydrogenase subunit A